MHVLEHIIRCCMELLVDHPGAMADVPVHIQVTNAKPGAKVQLRLETQDAHEQVWHSRGLFQADEHGAIDLAIQAPLRGDYAGVDAMGLFGSMRPQRKDIPRNLYIGHGLEATQFSLKVLENDAVVLEETLERYVLAPSIAVTQIDNDDVVGLLFSPASEQPLPGIAVIPGSSGVEASKSFAALLAAKGFVVLVVGIYNYKNLPKEMYHLPLERIERGIRWLANHDTVVGDSVAAYGVSKGAEGLLTTASYIHDLPLKAIALVSPSSVVWQGIGQGRPQKKSTWTFKGKPLPFLAPNESSMMFQALKSIFIAKFHARSLFPKAKVARFEKAYYKALNVREAQAGALIPAANIRCPVLLISGGCDELWPAGRMANEIADQLADDVDAEHVHYPDAGHIFRSGFVPMTVNYGSFGPLILGMGGTPLGNAQGAKSAWLKLQAFFSDL
jgi:dienelactone hydrolase